MPAMRLSCVEPGSPGRIAWAAGAGGVTTGVSSDAGCKAASEAEPCASNNPCINKKPGTNKIAVTFFDFRSTPLSFADVPYRMKVTHLFTVIRIHAAIAFGAVLTTSLNEKRKNDPRPSISHDI